MSYGENVTHNVNLSQFDNTEALMKFVKQLPQQTGFKTMTFQGIDTARYSPPNPPDESPMDGLQLEIFCHAGRRPSFRNAALGKA